MGLAQNLKAVADANNQAAIGGELRYAFHNRREARNRPAAQIVPITEAPWQHDALGASQTLILMPEQRCFLAENLAQRINGVAIVERAGETNDTPFHPPSTS